MNLIEKTLEQLREKGLFRISEAKALGVSPRMLSYYINKGVIERIARGVYAFPENLSFEFKFLIQEKLMQAPQAIIGLESALKIYELTDEAPADIDLIVPLSNVPKRRIEDVKLHQMKDSLYKKEVYQVDGLPITGVERTLIDFLRTQAPLSKVLDVMFRVQQKGQSLDLSKMKKMAKEFRVQGRFENLMDAYL